MLISLVAAAAENNVIGKDNQLVWNLPNDTRFFKNTTWGMPVIMGRKTFEALQNKPLNGRHNIVITHNPGALHPRGPVTTAAGLEKAIAAAAQTDAKEVFVIGGGSIYEAALPLAGKIVLTRVHASPAGDAFFPDFDKAAWELTAHQDFSADEKHAYSYSFQTWLRKQQL
jgi:dihydrofolate reductase